MTNEQIQQLAHQAKLPEMGLNPSNEFVQDMVRRIATLVRNATLEEAAIVAWNHYMDTCKQRKIPAAQHDHFIAATAIRNLKS